MMEPYQDSPYSTEDYRRFSAKFRANERGCLVWQAHADEDGYGQFKLDGRVERAHRAAWMLYRGPIEPGYDIDHKCPHGPNRRCVNIEHLEPVIHAENLRRRKKTAVDEADNSPLAYRPTPTDAETVLVWAEELLEVCGFKPSKYFYIQRAEDAPWREYANEFERGLGLESKEDSSMALIALYLYCVQLGVTWHVAARQLLQVSPITMKAWNQNPDWKVDFDAAKQKGKSQQWDNVEDTFLTAAERKVGTWEGKDVVNMLKVTVMRKAQKAAAKARRENPALPTGNNFIFMLPPGSSEETADGARSVIEGVFREVTEKSADNLPPPEDWEMSEDDD